MISHYIVELLLLTVISIVNKKILTLHIEAFKNGSAFTMTIYRSFQKHFQHVQCRELNRFFSAILVVELTHSGVVSSDHKIRAGRQVRMGLKPAVGRPAHGAARRTAVHTSPVVQSRTAATFNGRFFTRLLSTSKLITYFKVNWRTKIHV